MGLIAGLILGFTEDVILTGFGLIECGFGGKDFSAKGLGPLVGPLGGLLGFAPNF